MSEPTEERSLPYTDPPATAVDVALEMRAVSALIARVISSADKALWAHMLEDGTRDPGKSLVILETRLAIALESWLTAALEEFLTDVVGGLQGAIDKAVAEAVEKALDARAGPK